MKDILEQPIILTGKHVELAPLNHSHSQTLFEAGNDPEIWKVTQGHIHSLDTAAEYVQKALNQQNAMPFVITDLSSGRIVGSTRLYDISPVHRNVEIGSTWLTPNVWRTAINTECKYLLLKHCFETMGMIRVQFKTDARNVRSQKAIERLGAVKEGVWRSHMVMADGYIRDSVIYSIIDKEWPLVKAKFENHLNQHSDAK